MIIWSLFYLPCAEYITCVNAVEPVDSPVKGHTLPSTLSESLSLCTRGEKKRAAPINFAFKRQVRPRGAAARGEQ